MLSILTFSLASCLDDNKDNYIKHDELPEAAQSFLSKYLPDNKFISVRKDGYGVSLYAVQLEKDIEVTFSSDGTWWYIQSENGLPETVKTLLSENSQKELNTKYSSSKVTALSNNENGELIVALNNNKKFYDINAHEGYVLAEILDEEGQNTMPEKIKEFIDKYLIGVHPDVLVFTGFRGKIHRIKILDLLIVDFYQNGEWFYMKETGTWKVLPHLLIKVLPENILKTLDEKEPNAISALTSITRFNNNKLYGFGLSNKSYVVINSGNKVIEPPLEKAKELIRKGFNPQNELKYEIRSNTGSPYFLRYAFIATGQGVISLVTDIDGNLRNIGAGAITDVPEKTVPLPKAVLEMLPGAILIYLETAYPGKNILQITHSYSVEQDDIPEEVNLTMAIPNNLKVLIFNRNTGRFIRDYNVIRE